MLGRKIQRLTPTGSILLSLCLILVLLVSTVETRDTIVKIMPLGDSITRGGGSSGEIGYRRPLYLMLDNENYNVQLAGSLVNGYPADFDRDHEGHGSYRADQIRDNIYNWLSDNPVEIILLHVGINDIAGGNEDVAEVEAILDNIDQWETDQETPVTVVVARIVLRWDGQDPETIAFNDSVEAMVRERIALGDDLIMVDMEHALIYPDDLYDGVHPNDVGYTKMAQEWYNVLTGVLPPPSSPAGDVDVSNVILAATSPENSTDDDLVCTYDLEGDATTAATTWYKDATPLMTLYTPFEGGSDNALLDLSGHDHDVDAEGSAIAAWRDTLGHNGRGTFEFGPSFYLNAGEVFPTLSSYTKVAWVYQTDSAASHNIISSQDVTGGHVFYASQSQGNRLSAGHLGSWNIVQDPVPLDTGLWYHTAVSFDYTTGMMVLYKDGLEVDTATVHTDFRDVTDETLLIGSFAGGGGNAWIGLIDDARVYDHVLSPEQILALYDGSDLIKSTETSVGEVWQADVTPFSASEMGDAGTSNTLTIGDPAPWVSSVTLTATSPGSITTDDLICEYQLGGSANTTAVAWYKDAAPFMEFYLPFEGSGTSSQLDFSGNGHSVTAFGSPNPVWEPTGGPNGFGAYLFNSTNYFEADVFPTLSSYTKVAWVQMTDPTASHNILSSQAGAPGGHTFWASQSQGNRLTAGQAGTWTIAQDPTPLVIDQWYFVAVTFDYATGDMVLYKDDQIVDNVTVPTDLRDITDPILQVGALVNGSGWKGRIAEAQIYDFVVSPEQMLALYHGSDTIKSTETNVGEQWYADVTPFSTTEAGITVSSNTLQINSDSLMAPTLLSPPDTSIVYDISPTFDWTIAHNPWPERTTYYDLYVSTDSDFVMWVTILDSLISPGCIWELQPLDYDTLYWWKVVTWVDLDTLVVTAHSDVWSFWTWTLGDLDNSHTLDISDLVFMVDWMFTSGPAPDPLFVADIDGSCSVDISDLVYLVDYMFTGGPPPEVGCE